MSEITREEIETPRRLCAEYSGGDEEKARNRVFDHAYEQWRSRFFKAAREWLPKLLDLYTDLKEKHLELGSRFADLATSNAELIRERDALASDARGWRPTHRHYKGGLYRVVARGRNEADLSPVVIYDNAKGETWVRPVADFDGTVHDEQYGKAVRIPRFDPLPAPPADEEAQT